MSCCSESDVGGNISLFIVTFLSGALLSEHQFTPQDEIFMRRALALAEQAELEGEVPVGAVLVKDGEVIAEG